MTTQNAGANKIDAYVHEALDDQIAYNSGTGVTDERVTLTLHNDAPASGLPPIVIDNSARNVPVGAAYTWVSIYSRLHVTGASVDGRTLTLARGRELGLNVYSNWVTVPSKGTIQVVVTLAGTLSPGRPYQLELRLQPMANAVTTRVSVDQDGHDTVWHPDEVDQTKRF